MYQVAILISPYRNKDYTTSTSFC